MIFTRRYWKFVYIWAEILKFAIFPLFAIHYWSKFPWVVRLYFCLEETCAHWPETPPHSLTPFQLHSGWELTPTHCTKLDIRWLLQADAIEEVEMEDTTDEPDEVLEKKSEEEEEEEEDDDNGVSLLRLHERDLKRWDDQWQGKEETVRKSLRCDAEGKCHPGPVSERVSPFLFKTCWNVFWCKCQMISFPHKMF